MPETNIDLVAGEPFDRNIRVTGAAAVWPTVDSVEVRSQVRSGPKERYPLIADLAEYLALSIDGADVVIDLNMTGAQTRALAQVADRAHYDMFLSDPGPDDTRAIKIQYGRITVEANVTAGSDA